MTVWHPPLDRTSLAQLNLYGHGGGLVGRDQALGPAPPWLRGLPEHANWRGPQAVGPAVAGGRPAVAYNNSLRYWGDRRLTALLVHLGLVPLDALEDPT